MSRERRRRTFVVWLSLYRPGTSPDLQQAWEGWISNLEANRKPLPADLVAFVPKDFQLAAASIEHLRRSGMLWVGCIRWRDRRDVETALNEILAGLPKHPDVDWIWLNITEGTSVLYRGTAAALSAASFVWTS